MIHASKYRNVFSRALQTRIIFGLFLNDRARDAWSRDGVIRFVEISGMLPIAGSSRVFRSCLNQ